MRRYKILLKMRTKLLMEHRRRIKLLEKRNFLIEQSLLEMRKDNDSLVKRFDQFVQIYEQQVNDCSSSTRVKRSRK